MQPPKSYSEISTADLQEHPVWREALEYEEDYDEMCVTPVLCTEVARDNEIYYIACNLTLATGKKLLGFVSICYGKIDDEAPIVVTDFGDQWPLDYTPSPRHQESFKRLFESDYESIFPVQWQLLVKIEGDDESLSGVYDPTVVEPSAPTVTEIQDNRVTEQFDLFR